MTYQESLDWIHQQLKFGIKPGLQRVAWLLNEFGNPQHEIKGIHVVGTNGKGSTVSYLQHIFTESGYEVGTFTSPYIIEFRERISVNGQMISEQELIDLVGLVRPVVERLPKETSYAPATEFEIITVMMFLYFTRIHPVDIAIIEAGLGGLYDSTNVFQALAVVCPSIGLDHQDILGEGYVSIAEQKAGVLKGKEPFIFATEREDVRAVFLERCQATASTPYELGQDFSIQLQGERFNFAGLGQELIGIDLAMLGRHQRNNAALAVMVSLLLQENYPQVTLENIKSGLRQTHWLGRTEFIQSQLMIDGAHNNESVAVLVDLLKSEFADKQIHILFAAIHTKPITTMLKLLDQFADLTVTTFDYPKSVSLDQYPQEYSRTSDFKTWLEKLDQAQANDLFVITGSLYFISQVREFVLSKNRKQEHDSRK